MKTKIGLPFGLALVVFVGIFTTMLALGALNPSRSQAFDGGFAVMGTNRITSGVGNWTFTLVTEGAYTNENVTTLIFPAGFNVSDGTG